MFEFNSLSLMTKFHLKRMSKKGLFSKYLLELESRIIDELQKPLPKTFEADVLSQNLIFRADSPNGSMKIWTRVRIFARILKTRGQCRWLCFLLFSPVRESAYILTRNKLLYRILFNWKTFSKEVLAYLTISSENTQGLSRITLSQYADPRTTNFLDMNCTYVLEGEYHASLAYRGNVAISGSNTFVRILLWNSSYGLLLIAHSPRLRGSSELQKFLERFPDFLELLRSREPLAVVFHPQSGKTLDERFGEGRMASPDVSYEVEIWHQRFIVQNEDWMLIDSTCSPEIDFVAGHWQFLEQNKLLRNRTLVVRPRNANILNLDTAIFLMGRVDENWFHLLLDTFPRYLQFEGFNPDIPVLVRGDLPESSINFLKKVISHDLIFVQPKDLVSVKTLYYVAGRSTVYDSVLKNNELRVAFSPISLERTKELIFTRLGLISNVETKNKIYLTRNSRYRNLVNENTVASIFQNSHYSRLEPNEEFFRDQFQYFAKAKHIVSPGGASLANIIFMSAGSRVTAMHSWRGSKLKIWAKLAEACHVEFDEIVGISIYFGHNSLAREHSNFYIPITRLKKILKN